MMERTRIGLALVTDDLRKARSRNRRRISAGALQSKAIDTILAEMTTHIRRLRIESKRLDRLENREKKAKVIEKGKRSHEGINTKLTGTIGC